MTILNEQFPHGSTHHPSDEQMLNYFEGKLTESSHDSVQAHLVECDACLETFKDIREFFEPHRADEEIVNEDRLRSWTALWDKIRDAEERSQLADVSSIARRPWFKSATALAMAAMLLVILGLGVWIVRQRQQQNQLTSKLQVAEQQNAQLQAEHDNLAARTRELEEANLALQEQAGSKNQPRSPRRPNTSTPDLNAPSYDIYARNFIQRSGNQNVINRVKVPASDESFLLLLNVDGLPHSSDYGVEIINESGRMVSRTRGLKKGQLGNLPLPVSRSLLGPGTYTLKLHAGANWSSKALAEYLVRVD